MVSVSASCLGAYSVGDLGIPSPRSSNRALEVSESCSAIVNRIHAVPVSLDIFFKSSGAN